MAASDVKSGPITQAELLALWQTTVDSTYADPLVAAGEGNGLEAYTQGQAQLARVSTAIDVTTQALYIRPWSGQSNPSAQGGQKATVTLSFTRTKSINQVMIIGAGTVFIEEQTTDWGTPTGQLVTTGRRYTLQQDLVFQPGVPGPLTAVAIAERVGFGYNNPRPGAINLVDQPGTQYTNTSASVALIAAPANPIAAKLVAANVPNVFLPGHIGQYVQLTAGSNNGLVTRIVAYTPPGGADGGQVYLELVQTISATTFAGSFVVGEIVDIKNGGTVIGTGKLLATQDVSGTRTMTYLLLTGTATGATSLLGETSAATATIAMLLQVVNPVAETGSASWRILDWVIDFGLTVSNAASPTGGLAPFLDELGKERNLPRAPGESDATYALRVWQIADVVTPNAIKRAINRVLAPLSATGCLREVGDLPSFPGMFCDAGSSTDGGAPGVPVNSAANYPFDVDEVTFSGGSDFGTFIDGEPLYQAASGARGRALLARTAGSMATSLDGATRLQGPAFIVGNPILGVWSSATRTPTGVGSGVRTADRFKLEVDFLEMRGFFLVGVPLYQIGDFGMAFDGSIADTFPLLNAFDATLSRNFFDGTAAQQSVIYRAIFDAISAAKAGGVGFDLYQEVIGCP